MGYFICFFIGSTLGVLAMAFIAGAKQLRMEQEANMARRLDELEGEK